MKLTRRTWTGSWIEPEQERAYREPELTFEEMAAAEGAGFPGEQHLKNTKHLRRKMDLKNTEGDLPVRAVCFASAHGVYDLYINGQKADARILAPETTNYEKLLWYQKYDITDLISESDIACVDVLLGDGWWIGRLGMAGSSCNYGDKLAFLMDMELTYPDGSRKVIGTDEQFVSCDSFIRYSDLYIGEMQDGTAFDFIDGEQGCPPKEQIEQTLPIWTACRCVNASQKQLTLQELPGIEVREELPCIGYIDNPKGELVADFGRVLAGVVRIRIKAEPGTEITLEHGEVLNKEGNYFNNIKGLYKDQKDRYLCRGGEQTFVPHFTYHGFRYVRITGISKENIIELTALTYSTPFEKTGYFETNNELINGLQRAIENSTVSNMISVPTDCPQREKLGWTGDINVFTGTGAFLYDLRDFLRSYLLQVRLDQLPDGEIPVVVPNHPCQDAMQRGMSGGTNSSAAWSDCCIFMPLELYRIYGDKSILEENYETMLRWLDYVQEQAKGGLWNARFHFGDWLIPSLREEPDGVMRGVAATADIVGSCYYAIALNAMVQVCTILEKTQEAASFQMLAEQVQEAILNNYVYKDGQIGVHAAGGSHSEAEANGDLQLQGLYVVMLRSGAVKDPDLKKRMLNRLVKLIRDNDYALDCGFASIGFLLDVLYDNGYRDVAFRMLLCEKAPSWLYMVRNGATTIWENWRAIREDGTATDSSYNHYAYGCVGSFMYRHIGGIEILEPGFRKIRIAPDFDCGIRSSSLKRILPGQEKESDNSRYILVQWNLDRGMHVEIPEGVSAWLEIPGRQELLMPGTYEFAVS